ncbi:glucuronate isomerase [Octadecabacter sp.]|nr:glucuronate isomerase [Octadecabacter sp.]
MTPTAGIALPSQAAAIYEGICDLPIVSPHGHCDPSWWANDEAFPNPSALLIQPDHYVFRMLYSQGVPLENLGIGPKGQGRDPREVFQIFAAHWHLFAGTPSRQWLDHTFTHVLNIDWALSPDTADQIYEQIADKLKTDAYKPRALFDRFNISHLATTDPANATLGDHKAIENSEWGGCVIPTFRPDDLLNPTRAGHRAALVALAQMTGRNVQDYSGFLDALRDRRSAFRAAGATATDHDVPQLMTHWLDRGKIESLHSSALNGSITEAEAQVYYGHMLTEMAQMSVEDGMVMQVHAGSSRNTNQHLFETIGPDMGSDIPMPTNWVGGMAALLNRVGNVPNLRIILFTLDESTYARELAPMAGHWPCLRIGPPWWFHDSLNGIRRYFDAVVETAGYHNLAGFNDDTRAFLSIPARHDLWRRGVALHLADQIDLGVLSKPEAADIAQLLAHDLAIKTYRLEET